MHISDTAIWCDSIRARDLCFVSSAEALRSRRHGQVIASPATLKLLASPRLPPEEQLGVPYGRPFTVGTTRLELFSTGHAIGSAGLWVRGQHRDVIYAGHINPVGGAGGGLDSRSADVLILAAHYGDPSYRFEGSYQQVFEFCADVGAAGTAVLLVTSPLKGLEVAARLEGHGSCWLAPTIYGRAKKLDWVGAGSERVLHRASASCFKPGRTVIWPLAAVDRLPALPPASKVALVSGESVSSERIDRTIACSSRADYNQLIEFIDGVGASEVWVTGRFNDRFCSELDGPKRRFRPLGPPQQLSLL